MPYETTINSVDSISQRNSSHSITQSITGMVLRSLSPLVPSFVAISAIVFMAILYYQPAPTSSLPAQIPTAPQQKITARAVSFQDDSLNWQLTANHRQTSKHLSALTETLGSGICAIDANKDGWIDLFFVGGSSHTRHYGKKSWWHKTQGNRLLLNKQGHHFEDVTEATGLQSAISGMGCAVADLNNDGFTDLIVTGIGKNQVYKNNGGLSFSDVTEESGIANNHWSTGASLSDFNGDGLIDIYISGYILFKKDARTFERTSGFYTTNNAAFDQTLYDPEANHLYLNMGGFRFKETANAMGVSNSLGRSLGAKWIDINRDSWPDLLVINDHNTPNQLFINENGKGFSRGGDSYAAFEIAGAHDVSINDFDNDAQQEFFMSRGMGHPPVLLAQTSASATSQKSYTDQAWERGLAQAQLLAYSGWASTAADFNNDGFLDLYIANGNALPDIDSHFVPQAQTNSLFINNGNGNFNSHKPTIDLLHPHSSRGAISVDLNNDGQLEMVVSNNNDVLQVFKNISPTGNWIGIDLLATFNEAEIYDAQLTARTDTQTIYRTLQSQQAFLSQSDGRVHIGLGHARQINELIIHWRDGSKTTFSNIDANQYYIVDRKSNSLKPKTYQHITNSHFDYLLPNFNDKTSTLLAKLLINTSFTQDNQGDILHLWQQASPTTRRNIFEYIARHRDRNQKILPVSLYLALMKQALADKDNSIRRRAVEQIKKDELEASMAWLIPRLFDEDIKVQCSVAEAFRFFFNEEEAVTHRKKLAISPLIKLLESGSPQAAICAAGALAAAENKRAILPLISLTKQTHDHQVKVAAIHALGLIRDTKALALIRQQATNPDSTAPVVASSLTALSRLNDPELHILFDQFFFEEKSTPRTAPEWTRLYDTLNYLLSTPDGIVFPQSKLINTLDKLLEKQLSINLKTQQFKTVTPAALRAIASTKSQQFESNILNILNINQIENDRSIHSEALIALATLNTASSRNQFETLLLKQSPASIRITVNRLANNHYSFSQKLVSTLYHQTSTSLIVLDLLQQLPKKRASILFASLLTQTQNESQLSALLTICTKENFFPPVAQRSLWSNPSTKIRLQAIDCYLQRHQDSPANIKGKGTDLKHNLATHRMVKSLLTDSQIDSDTKIRLLIKAATSNAIVAKTTLSKRLESLPENWLLPALKAIKSSGVTAIIEDMLWSFYRNIQLDSALRLQAAIMLVDLYKETNNKEQISQVLVYLFESFPTLSTGDND